MTQIVTSLSIGRRSQGLAPSASISPSAFWMGMFGMASGVMPSRRLATRTGLSAYGSDIYRKSD